MSAETNKRPQDVNPKRVNLSTYLLSMALNTVTTAVIIMIVSWFMWTNIHADARKAVVADMTVVSKAQK